MPIFQRLPSQVWYCDLVGPNGRVKRSTGTKDKVQAQAFHDAEQIRLWTVKKLGDGGAHTFREAATRWLNETEKKTADKDAYQLAWFNKHIGDEWLSTINIDTINTLRVLCATDEDGRPRSKATVNLYMACLRSVLRKAQSEWGWLTAVPKVPMYGKGKKAKYYLTPAEFERLLAELPEHLQLAAVFAVETGLRMRFHAGTHVGSSEPQNQARLGALRCGRRRGWTEKRQQFRLRFIALLDRGVEALQAALPDRRSCVPVRRPHYLGDDRCRY